ncbi:MAG: HAMP domain-containing histidine kinase [Flavobacteriales bacterium]|nr:HAMP domain-containing histidine kinase [Flavobacteriales bacterium]
MVQGIPEELREKIFVPNFTTKSSGMGLGLAMVKNIVETCNGKIWFESEIGKGTVFISLPAD